MSATATRHMPRHLSWLFQLTLLLTACLTIMAGATISPSLPGITAAFRDTAHIELLSRLVLTLPALFVVFASPVIGRIADHLGRKPLLIIMIILYALAGSSGLYLDSIYGLLAGRALLGIAVAGIMTLGTALVGDFFDSDERDRYMGLQQAFTGFGGLVFLTAGGFLADIDWRYPFAIYAIALPLVPMVWRVLTEPNRDGTSATTPESAAVARLTPIMMLCLVAFFASASFYILPSQLPYRLEELGLMSPTVTGLALGLMTFISAMASLSFSRLRKRLSASVIFAVGLTAMALGIAATGVGAALVTVMCGTALTGLGMGFVMPNIFSRAIALAPSNSRGQTAGFVTASLFLGQFVSPFLTQPIIATFGFTVAFCTAAGLTIASLPPAILSGERG